MSASLRLVEVRGEKLVLSLSCDRKESPFPGPNELPSFPRGRILHGARLDGRRPGREARRRRSAPKEREGSFAIVFARTFRAYFISSLRPSPPLYLFFRVFVSSAASYVARRSFPLDVSPACFVVDCVKRFHGDCQTRAIRPFSNRAVIFSPGLGA